MDIASPHPNTLTDILGRLVTVAEKWFEKQVGEKEVPETERMLTPKEASVLLNLHVQTVMAWCREGKLHAEKVGGNEANGKGGRYRIPREAINAYLHRQRLIHGQRRRNAK